MNPVISTPQPLTLVGLNVCPFVQRARILLTAARIDYEQIWVDVYGSPPALVKELNPLGKVPILRAGSEAVFDSSVILDYIDELSGGRFNQGESLLRAQRRSWVAFASSLHDSIRTFFSTNAADQFDASRNEIRSRLRAVEERAVIRLRHHDNTLSIVDAAFAPVFVLLALLEKFGDWRFLEGCPQVQAWKDELLAHDAVRQAVHPEYSSLMEAFLRRKSSHLSALMH